MQSSRISLGVLALLLTLTASGWSALVQFTGSSANQGIPLSGWAEIAVQDVGLDGVADALIIEIANTSPVQTDPGIANPLLTGFGFWLDELGLDNNDVNSWSAALGSDSTDVTSLYSLTAGNGIGSGLNYFTTGITGQGNSGRIGNPAASGQIFDVPTVIFDSVVFTFLYDDGLLDGLAPEFFQDTDTANIALRFQSIGDGGADSGAGIPNGDDPPPTPAVPEPATMILLGVGCLALGGSSRFRRV